MYKQDLSQLFACHAAKHNPRTNPRSCSTSQCTCGHPPHASQHTSMALATRGGFSLGAEGSLTGSSIQSRGGGPGSFAQKSGLLHSTSSRSSGGPALTRGNFGLRHAQTVSAALLELDTRSTLTVPSGKILPRHGPTLLEVTHGCKPPTRHLCPHTATPHGCPPTCTVCTP